MEGFPPPVNHEHATAHLEQLFNYLGHAHRTAGLASFLGAVIEGQTDVRPSGDDYTDNPLAALDIPDSIANQTHQTHELETMCLQPALQATGLAFDADPYLPSIYIVNGEAFTASLAALSEADPTVQNGLKGIVGTFLGITTDTYVPTLMDSGTFANFHLVTEAIIPYDNEAITRLRNQAKAETLLHAPIIAEHMERLGVDEEAVQQLKRVAIAEKEGLLHAWAVANHWGLYRQPTTYYGDSEWAQWSLPEEWGKAYEFLASTARQAPPSSQFMRDLGTAFLAGLANLRAGNLRQPYDPPKPLAPAVSSPDDDYWPVEPEDTNTDYHRQLQAEYEALLGAAEQKLQIIFAPYLHQAS